MAIFQTNFADGRKTLPVPYCQGAVMAAVIHAEILQAFTAASDIFELCQWPAEAKLIGATLIAANTTGAVTADIGIMDGTPGDDEDDTRALTSDLIFDGTNVADGQENEAAVADCIAIASAKTHRALGMTLSANQAAAAGKTISVLVRYTY